MGHSDSSIYWKSETISKMMQDNDIRNREQLAARLEPRGISRRTVYRAFAEDWNGEAAIVMITALAREFRVALSQLVNEPFRPTEESR